MLAARLLLWLLAKAHSDDDDDALMAMLETEAATGEADVGVDLQGRCCSFRACDSSSSQQSCKSGALP